MAPKAAVAPKESWERQVERDAWQLQKEQWRADEEKTRDERRVSNKNNRDVEELLRREDSVRLSIKSMDLGKTVRDGAGVEWSWDAKTRWWWWLAEDGTWQSKGCSWTPLPQKNGTKRGMRRQSDASDVASEKSAASSVSTAPTLPKREEKVVVPKQRPSAWDKPLVVAAATPTPPPVQDLDTSAPASPTTKLLSEATLSVALAEAEVSTEPEGQSLSRMVASIRGELDLDDSLTMAQVIAEANLQLGRTAEGNLAEQARSLLREIA